MSTTAFEIKGPNKALFRTGAIAGSAVLWGVLGYLALTYVPKMAKLIESDGGPTVDVYKPPKPIVIIPPLSEPPKTVKDRPLEQIQAPTNTPPPLTARRSASTKANPLAGDLPSGSTASEPVIFNGGSVQAEPREWEEPVVLTAPPELPPIVEPIAPPAPKLTINPVRLAGANPTFPLRALDRGISGEVTLSFTVTPAGKVENISVTGERPSGYGFAHAAREAIANWTFQPQTIDGVAVAYPARYTISFKLED